MWTEPCYTILQVEHLALTPDVGRRVRALAAALEEGGGAPCSRGLRPGALCFSCLPLGTEPLNLESATTNVFAGVLPLHSCAETIGVSEWQHDPMQTGSQGGVAQSISRALAANVLVLWPSIGNRLWALIVMLCVAAAGDAAPGSSAGRSGDHGTHRPCQVPSSCEDL